MEAAALSLRLWRSFGCPGHNAQVPAVEAKPLRPQVAPIPSLRTLRAALRTLRCIAVVAAPLAFGVGCFTGTADFCFDIAFFNAEIAERGAERAEKNVMRPAVAVWMAIGMPLLRPRSLALKTMRTNLI